MQEESWNAEQNYNYNRPYQEKEQINEQTIEEVEQRLKLTVVQARLAIMERVKEATEKGDLELASRWLNVLNTIRNLLGKLAD